MYYRRSLSHGWGASTSIYVVLAVMMLAGTPLSVAQSQPLEPPGQQPREKKPPQDVGSSEVSGPADEGQEGGAQPAEQPVDAPVEAAPQTTVSDSSLTESSAFRDTAAANASDDGVQTDAMEDEPRESDEVQPETTKSYPSFQVGGRLIAGAHRVRTHPEIDQQSRNSRQPFFLKQPRVKLSARLNKWMRLAFSADLDSQPAIRSAFANVRVKRYLQFRAGRFKRPMSRVELTSIGSLPFIDRGLANHALLEKAAWGDRALGAMMHGKFKGPRLRYYAAVMNSAPSVATPLSSQLRGVDTLGRVQWSPSHALSFGINGGHKVTEARVSGALLHLNAVGADVRVRVGELSWVAETIASQNLYPPTPPLVADRTPWAMYVVSFVQYDLNLPHHFVLQPVLSGEWVDTDMEYAKDEGLRGLVGVNLVWRKHLRLMPYVEVVRPVGGVSARSFLSSETYAIALSLQI